MSNAGGASWQDRDGQTIPPGGQNPPGGHAWPLDGPAASTAGVVDDLLAGSGGDVRQIGMGFEFGQDRLA